ncbi:MAG: hypothetical protein CMI19_01055 [Opitutae bacterium]|nr:hypothetical protein [Opitutae bacterium]|tara:strand:+ start:37 stop:762 length:726 start_codon:yes stop_codon:yes gene_type:complete
MPNAYLFKMMACEDRFLYIILESPGSGGFEFLVNGLNDFNHQGFHFLLPESTEHTIVPSQKESVSFWPDNESTDISFNLSKNEENIDLFLFLSPSMNISDQFESLLSQTDKPSKIEIGRIISFLDANILPEISTQFQVWLDAVAHFSDVLCFSNRSNQNGKSVKMIIDRYENMRYPMETYLISQNKKGKLLNILNPTARRITHIFDSPDLLDSEETPEDDPYLKKLANGKREKVIPIPFPR